MKRPAVLRLSRNNSNLLIITVAIAVVGSGLLIATHAATSTVTVEPETASLATKACALTDTTASGSGAVKFGGTCNAASRTLDCYATPTTPHLCGFPDATTTGIQPGHTLTLVPATGSGGGPGWTSSGGDVTICAQTCSAPGTPSATVNDLEVPVNHVVIVVSGNVTIKNLKVNGQSGQTHITEFYAVEVEPAAHNVTIDHCNLIGDATSPDSGPAQAESANWVNRGSAAVKIGSNTLGDGGYGVTVTNCNMHGFFGPIWNYQEKAGGPVRFSRNYIHGVECWGGNGGKNQTCSSLYPSSGSTYTDHCNIYGQSNQSGLQAGGTQSVLIDNNTMVSEFQPCHTGLADADSDNAPAANLQWVVDHNLIGYSGDIGSSCVVPGRTGGSGKSAGLPSYVAITNNHIFNCSPWLYDGPSIVGTGVGESPTNVECGNLYDNGPNPGKSTDSWPWWDGTAAQEPAVTTCTMPSWAQFVPGWKPTQPGTF